ncbi:Hypothetical predicted protein, partial [Paramuricea clavata]
LSMDWKLCIICQRSTKEALQCSARSKRKDAGAGYFSFIRSALGYKAELGMNPVVAQNLQCFFCDKQDSPDNLHCASTLE